MVEIVKFDVQKYIRPVAIIYDQVFADPPWNDEPKGLKVATEDILSDLSRQSAQGLLAILREQDEPVGFAWGFVLSTLNFAINKYNTVNQQYIIDTLPRFTGFYLAEIGIRDKFRKRGLATTMAVELVGEKRPAFVRTLAGSRVERIAQNLLGMKISNVKDPEDNRRVIYYRL